MAEFTLSNMVESIKSLPEVSKSKQSSVLMTSQVKKSF